MYVVLMRSTSPLWHRSGVVYLSWSKAREFAQYVAGLVPDTITSVVPRSRLTSFAIISEE